MLPTYSPYALNPFGSPYPHFPVFSTQGGQQGVPMAPPAGMVNDWWGEQLWQMQAYERMVRESQLLSLRTTFNNGKFSTLGTGSRPEGFAATSLPSAAIVTPNLEGSGGTDTTMIDATE
ncbi:hypothetical protein L1987_01467 [Smallanthus sonchifolius]|uniref:Uncharacterized protein n=1 Tax=Smallanthus sonchifolius TaxID=185202 RepID=A0ACB9K558_9ASTR|nr:hypothetical protein L1987_01467 [Smallanthus sonchifolius]